MGAETVGGLQPRGHTHARAVTEFKFPWFSTTTNPWSADGELMLAMEVDYDRPATAEDSIRVELSTSKPVMAVPRPGRDQGWQQGASSWLATDPNQLIIYNSIEDGRYVRSFAMHSGETRTIPRPIYAVSPDDQAVSLTSRTGRCRQLRYRALPDRPRVSCTDDDGIWRGRAPAIKLIVSIDQVVKTPTVAAWKRTGSTPYSPAPTAAFLWLHRWYRPGGAALLNS